MNLSDEQLENQLRDHLERAARRVTTAGLKPLRDPAPRHRWVSSSSWLLPLGAATIVIVLVAVVTQVMKPATQATPAAPDAGLTGDVIARTSQALAAAQRGAVEVTRTTMRHGMFQTANADAPVPALTSWYYRGRSRWEGFSTTGSPVFDNNEMAVRVAGRPQYAGTAVNYSSRTWWHGIPDPDNPYHYPGRPQPRPSCRTPFAPGIMAGGAPGDEATAIREAWSCGQIRAAGQETVGGVNAIKLVSARPIPGLTKGHFTLWVDPATYLPVRTRWDWAAGEGKPGSILADFQWLPATAANRAALNVPVPAGFRQVPVERAQNALGPSFGIAIASGSP